MLCCSEWKIYPVAPGGILVCTPSKMKMNWVICICEFFRQSRLEVFNNMRFHDASFFVPPVCFQKHFHRLEAAKTQMVAVAEKKKKWTWILSSTISKSAHGSKSSGKTSWSTGIGSFLWMQILSRTQHDFFSLNLGNLPDTEGSRTSHSDGRARCSWQMSRVGAEPLLNRLTGWISGSVCRMTRWKLLPVDTFSLICTSRFVLHLSAVSVLSAVTAVRPASSAPTHSEVPLKIMAPYFLSFVILHEKTSKHTEIIQYCPGHQ